ncbi:sodium/potassium/calcium exchanger 4-like [Liolophura sinensis]|uniref:sodium/potassium/calcium exchanger 4-like n=1 Tax=Liolophura sinensis TaxID=3198878 RepID=UPI003158CB7C
MIWGHYHHLLTSIRHLNAAEICTEPGYHQFPTDAFTTEERAHGAILLHFVMVVYMFVALAIVCDDYFVTSLDKICEKLGFSEDVAGATFMAAGSSAPELFTSIIGVFITKGDVGVGTIVGSAVFNILFVIGICGILVGKAIPLSWFPLCRDSIFYSLSVITLILVVYDSVVTWYESLAMLLLYMFYIVIMRFNPSIRCWVMAKVQKLKDPAEFLEINGTIMQNFSVKRFQGDYEVFNDDDDEVFATPQPQPQSQPQSQPIDIPRVDEYAANNRIKILCKKACFRFMMKRSFPGRTRFQAAARLIISYRRLLLKEQAQMRRQQFKAAGQRASTVSYTKSVRNWFSMTYEGENYDAWIHIPNPRESYLGFAKWALTYPLRGLMYVTVPDCRKKKWERWFMVTFFMSIFWIAVFSYVMVWMVTLIGYTFNIADSVMGITFLAAGTSIPDAMASVFVAKQGMGDMAVSNSIGSNVFDILLGLSLPWFLKTGIFNAGTTVQINSNGMFYSIILLFLTVIITLAAIHCSGWILNRCVGIVCMIVYGVYLVFSVMIECNVFGYVNPPMCKE